MSSSNEHYGRLNEQFERRSVILRDLGFKYQHLEEWDTAVFYRPRPGKKVPTTVAASFVIFADDRSWSDRLEEVG